MKQQKKYSIILMILLLSAGLFAQKITIKIASVAPGRSPWDIEQRRLAQEWSEVTNGQVNLQFFDTAALGGEYSVIQKMRSVRPGQKSPLDGAIFTTIGIYELAPETDIYTYSVPFLFRSQEELDLSLSTFGTGMSNAITEQGYVVLGWFNVGWITFFTKDEVHSIADLKKVKLTTSGMDSAVLGNALKAAGYHTEDVPGDKVLQSLRSNSGVRGFYSVPMYAYAKQFSKYANYAIDYSISPVMAALVISKQTWDSIPAEYKPALLAAVEKTRQKFIGTQKATDREYLDLIVSEGVKLIKIESDDVLKWENDFNKDIPLMTKGQSAAINAELLQKIQKMLNEYRAGKH